MNRQLQQDLLEQEHILESVLEDAKQHLQGVEERFVAPKHMTRGNRSLPKTGLGAQETRELFNREYRDSLMATTGPRYFGFVIGGTTPAALAGDWLTSLYDQNAFGFPENADRHIEDEAVGFLRELVGLDKAFFGSLCSGATMANFVGLATARQWYGQQRGINVAEEGCTALGQMNIASGCAHASTYKTLSMLGLGRRALTKIPCIPGREAVDLNELEAYLKTKQGEPVVVIANLGTANSGDSDDLVAICELKRRYGFYLHADAAIIGIAAGSKQFKEQFATLDQCDSLTIDAHKWLNTPYDGAVQLTKHKDLQYQVFAQAIQALPAMPEGSPLFNMTPEGSRRLRALAVWFSMMAYGKDGYEDIVERNCSLTRLMEERLDGESCFKKLNDVRFNILCYTLNTPKLSSALVEQYTALLREKGITYSNTTDYFGTPAIRACVSNWRTTPEDVEKAFASMKECAQEVLGNL